MILEKQTEALVLEDGEKLQESVKMSLDMDSANILMDMLSKNLYSDGIGSTIRECASNALDSHRKANVEDPIIVSLKENDQGNYEFSVEDFGVGIDSDDIVNIISKYGKSTKRNDENALGMMGLGFKAPLAYSSSFYFVCRKNGVERKYMMYEGEDGNTIDLLYESPTEERNGVKVIVPVQLSDAITFSRKINEQLCYFESVYFDVPRIYLSWRDNANEISNDFKIYRHELYQSSQMSTDRNMHLCLDNVYYPIDFSKLEINEIRIPIGLRFGLSDGIYPLPNRESIRYTKDTKDIILKKISDIANYFVTKYNSELTVESNIFAILDHYENNTMYANVGLDINYDITELVKHATIPIETPKVEGVNILNMSSVFPRNSEFLLDEYTPKYKIVNSSIRDCSKLHYDRDFRATKLKKMNVYFYEGRVGGIMKDYLRSIHSNGVYLVKKDKTIPLRTKSLYSLDYVNALSLNSYPKSQWRQVINEWKILVQQIEKNFINLDDLEIPKEFLEQRKQSRSTSEKLMVMSDGTVVPLSSKRKKLQGEVNCKIAVNLERNSNNKSCKFIPHIIKLEELHKDKFLTVYTSHENSDVFQSLYAISTKQKMRFITVSPREKKLLDGLEVHNIMTYEKFMEGNNMPFKRIATAFIIKKFQSDNYSMFDRLQHLTNVSSTFGERLQKLEQYTIKNYTSGVTNASKNHEEIIKVAKEKNLYDMNIYPEYMEVDYVVKFCLPFLNNFYSYMRTYGNNEYDSTCKILSDLFKYYKQRVNLKWYNNSNSSSKIANESDSEESENKDINN